MPASTGLCGALGIGGWEDLDPVLLAAVATEAPVLLVGPHGTAKTLLVRRLAAALGSELRHYNASLLNYDDLVGIPLPDETGQSLRFITLPASVWDAEFVFFDEISRCRPDLQNKLFPIVHDRAVQGLPIPGLAHRWAAMNPPAPTDADDAWTAAVYTGSEELDPALVDRFPYVVAVPGWNELSRDVRHAIATGADEDADVRSHGATAATVAALVAAAVAEVRTIRPALADKAGAYAVAVVDLLGARGLVQSPRRARMLAAAVVAVHAAGTTLAAGKGVPPPSLDESAFRALRNCLPQTAAAVGPAPADLLAVHRQAYEVAASRQDPRLHAVLSERDPLVRVVVADEHGCDDTVVARFVTGAIASAPTEGRRISLATAVFLRLRTSRDLTPAAWEPLGALAARVLTERTVNAAIAQGAPLRLWEDVNRWLATDGTAASDLERNYVLAGVPDVWLQEDWRAALEQFRRDLVTAGVAA